MTEREHLRRVLQTIRTWCKGNIEDRAQNMDICIEIRDLIDRTQEHIKADKECEGCIVFMAFLIGALVGMMVLRIAI